MAIKIPALIGGANVRGTEGGITVTLTASDSRYQVFNLSSSITVVLPSTGIRTGDRIILAQPDTRADITVQSSNTSALTEANGCNNDATITQGFVELVALQDTPTTPAHWAVASVEETGYINFNWQATPFTGPVGSFLSFSRTGRSVVLDFAGINVSASGSPGQVATSSSAIPTRCIPLRGIHAPMISINAGGTDHVTNALVFINPANGIVQVYRESNWSGVSTCGWQPFSVAASRNT